MEVQAGKLLSEIFYPSDLKKFKPEELKAVCDELRQYIIDIVSVNGGHFGASLGVVELTVALHYILNTPYDQLIWDVGHQAYGHKILTGRRKNFHTNRIYKGLSGFPKRSESEYDTFGVGHSSTSISAALGMAVASQLKGEKDRQHVAVIGDGAMTAGLAFEALNHAGIENSNLLVILNDNCMSIDMQLSFSITSRLEFSMPAWFNASKAKPAVMAPSPITATCCLSFSPFNCDATAMPNAADIDVDECPTPKVSYSLSLRLGKPLNPLYILLV